MPEGDRSAWQRLHYDSNWAEFHEQPEGSATEGMVPLFAGHRSFDGEVTEYDATVEGFAPDVPTARLYGLAHRMAEVLARVESSISVRAHPFWDIYSEVEALNAEVRAIEDDARAAALVGESAIDREGGSVSCHSSGDGIATSVLRGGDNGN